MQDFSFGIVPISISEGKICFLLIKQYDDFWSFPKGHPEDKESEIETASRELLEETGIIPNRILPDTYFTEKYSFEKDRIKINKTVKFFPGFCDKIEPTIDDKEITDAGWFEYEQALEKLTYKETKEILVQAQNFTQITSYDDNRVK